MADSRIEKALARIETAMARMETARPRQIAADASSPADHPEADNVISLVNSHERLREEVADVLKDLDALIEDMEG